MNIRTNIKLTILLLFNSLNIIGQNIKYAHYIIDSLASPYLCGRYYIKNSDRKAAEFIVSELKKDYLQPLTTDFFQYFKIDSLNRFSQTPVIIINNKKLKPGNDFILAGYSGNIKGEFRIKNLKNRNILHPKRFTNKFIFIGSKFLEDKSTQKQIFELIKTNKFKSKGYIIETERLTFVPSTTQKHFAVIFLKKGILKRPKNIKVNIKAEFIKNYKTQNIAAYLKGQTDTFIVITAHYDHIGCLGDSAVFTGAHDNASGVAMALDLARNLSNMKCRPKYSIAFIFFSGEELGLLGSFYYVFHPLFDLNKIKFLINLDLVGSGDRGIQVVNSKVYKKEFQALDSINRKKKYLPQIKQRGAAANSDHYPFYLKGVKSFYIYTLGEYKEYHNICDTRENVPLSGYNNVYRLLRDFIQYLENN